MKEGSSNRYSRYFTYIKPITRIPLVRNYGSTIFTLLVIIIFIFFAIKPTVETILVLQKKIENANQILKQLDDKSNNLAQGKKNYDSLNPQIKVKINSSIPDLVQLKTIAQTLEQLSASRDASVSALQIQPIVILPINAEGLGQLEEINFTFNTEGSYPNLSSILQQVLQSSRLFSINNVNIRKVDDGGSSLLMSIIGKAFYLN
jgi:Tfp pilus assembly protein PilO